MKPALRLTFLAALAIGVSSPAHAGDLKLTMQGGRVTIVAHDVPLRQILQEWARVGNTQIVNGDKIPGPAVTLELIDVPEAQALDTLLRSAAGYMAAPRQVAAVNESLYDRIMILPTSKAPAATAVATPAPFQPRQQPQPMTIDEDDEPVTPAVNMPTPPQPNQNPVVGAFPGPQPAQPQQQNVPPGQQPQPAPIMTAPRPGALPVPNAQPGVPPNPYGPSVVTPARPGGPGGPGGPGNPEGDDR